MITPENTEYNAQPDGRQIPEPERRMERLLGLLIVGLMLLNFPLISIFSVSVFVFGIPILYFYLFFVWFLIIGIMAFVLRKRPSESGGSTGSQNLTEP